ncbi:MAG TPA: hypothetical protein VG870_11895 [Chitinophagaceae bacterium]|nr:hypothetical protein [Chitinophagaceae bacterium]
MELEELKAAWQASGYLEIPANVKPEGPERVTPAPLLSSASRGPVARMKRIVLAELASSVLLLGAVAAYYFIAFGGWFIQVAWLYLGLLVLLAAYYTGKYRLLAAMACPACQVRESLQRRLHYLENYIRFSVVAGAVLVPLVSGLLGLFFLYRLPEAGHRILGQALAGRGTYGLTGSIILGLGILGWLVYQLNRWWASRLYGNHIQRLREQIAEMDAAE